MSLIWILVSLLLSVVVIILHVIALSCLSKVKLVNFFVSQKYLIVSLCVTELYFAISTFLDCIVQLFGFSYKFKHASRNTLVFHVLVHHGDIDFGQILGIPF